MESYAARTFISRIKIAVIIHIILMAGLLVYGHITYTSLIAFGQSTTLWLMLIAISLHWMIMFTEFLLIRAVEYFVIRKSEDEIIEPSNMREDD